LVGIDHSISQHRTVRLEPLPGHHQPELVEAGERRQIRGREGSVRHVEVFQMGGVRTTIIGRPPPLPRDRRADQHYTLICGEPGKAALIPGSTRRASRTGIDGNPRDNDRRFGSTSR
jgi:hypothetical protein